jgi:hypothetical protein
MEIYQSKRVKPKSIGRKLRSDLNLQRAPEKKGVQQGFGVYVYIEMITEYTD